MVRILWLIVCFIHHHKTEQILGDRAKENNTVKHELETLPLLIKETGENEDVNDTNTLLSKSKEERIVDIVSEALGHRYIPCSERKNQAKATNSPTLRCSCNTNSCGVSNNCCPDIDPNDVATPGQNSPTCQYLVDALYKNNVWMTALRSGKSDMPSDEKAHMQVDMSEKVDEDMKTFPVNGLSGDQRPTNATYIIHDNEYNVSGPSRYPTAFPRRENNLTNAEQKEHETDSTEWNEETFANITIYRKLKEIISHFPRYLVTDTCHESFKNESAIARCMSTNSSFLMDYVPVFTISGKLYKNSFCAQCNNALYYTRWVLVTDCVKLYTLLYLPSHVLDFLSMTRNCSVLFEPSPTTLPDFETCEDPSKYSAAPEIATCNVTGLWQRHVGLVQNQCLSRHDMRRQYVTVSGKQLAFRNMFCYICNTNTLITPTIPSKGHDNLFRKTYLRMEVVTTDNVITGYSEGISQFNETQLSCPGGTVLGVYGEGCVTFRCPINEIPLTNFCVPNRRVVRGLVIGAYIYMKPVSHVQENSMDSEVKLNLLANEVVRQLDKTMQITENGCVSVYVRVLVHSAPSSDNIRRVIVQYKISNTDTCSIETIASMFKLVATKSFTIQANIFRGINTKSHSYAVNMAYDKIDDTHYNFKVTLINKPVAYEIILGPAFDCPRVAFSVSIFNAHVIDGNIDAKYSKLTQYTHLQESGDVEMCYTDYLEHWIITTYTTTRPSTYSSESKISPQFTLASTVISIVSTLAVLVTYGLFSELRFVPGKLFMVLCFNLLLAHCFFAFGIELVDYSVLCTIMGFCIHVFWLATTFSMNNCLWLMLKNFQQPLEADNRAMMQSKSNSVMFRYIFCCYPIPIVCSIINVTVASSWYNDTNYGYGGTVCFISAFSLKIATFIVPIVIVLLANSVLFALIIMTITKFSYTNRKALAHNQVTVFFKLSTVTGIYWLFGFLYEATSYRVFEYLFIALNGGQGFLLMWSFLFNRRVLQLYRTFYKKHIKRHSGERLNRSLTGSGSTNCHKSRVVRIASSDV